MSGKPRIAPFYPNDLFIGRNGRITDRYRKWFADFSSTVNDHMVQVRRDGSTGTRSNQSLPLFQHQRMTTTNRDDIEPADLQGGMVIFNTTTSKLQVYDGTVWADLH